MVPAAPSSTSPSPSRRVPLVRLLSYLGAIVLLLSALPVAASAKGGPHAPDPGSSEIVYLGDGQYTLSGTDTHRSRDELVRFTPAHGSTTATNKHGVEAQVIDGVIVAIEDRVGSMSIPDDGWVLSGHGDAARFLRDHAEVGGAVRSSAEEPIADEPVTEEPVADEEEPVAEEPTIEDDEEPATEDPDTTVSDEVFLGDGQYILSGTDMHRSTDELVRFTPDHGPTTETNEYGVEAQVIDGVIVAIEDRVGSMSIPDDGWVLSGHGDAAQFLRDHAEVGGTVRWSTEQPVTNEEEPVTDEGASSSDTALTWAPPSGWEDYTEVVLPPTGGTIDLASDVDYRISAPETRTDPIHIRGGRNVVWVGGHVRIEGQPDFSRATERRAIVLSDATDGSSEPGRVIHLEGLLLDGEDLSEGINTNSPSAIVQLQNIRVEEVRLRGADDRDGTGDYASMSHPDVVQLWGSKQELRIDGLTGRSNYQGLFLNEDTADRRLGPNYFRRVDLEMVSRPGEDGRTYAGHRGYTWSPGSSGRQFIDSGTVWLASHQDSGWTDSGSFRRSAYRDASGRLVDEPVLGTSTFGDNLAPAARAGDPYTLQLGTDALGTFGYWLDDATVDVAPDVPAVRDFADQGPGRIYSGHPPEGDYVPADSVGIGYVSPGYGG